MRGRQAFARLDSLQPQLYYEAAAPFGCLRGGRQPLTITRASNPRDSDPAMNHNQIVGKWGEQAAADYLTAHGYEIIGRNLRTPYGEIDLLARSQLDTVFVEVKARTSKALGPPEISVGPRKQAHMIACAQHYAQQNLIDHWRIDVVAVEKAAGKIQVTHFQNAVS